MAFLKDNKYWKITDLEINRQMGTTQIYLKGYASKEASDKHEMQLENKRVGLSGSLFPFVNDATPNQIALAYINIKEKDTYFSDAEEV